MDFIDPNSSTKLENDPHDLFSSKSTTFIQPVRRQSIKAWWLAGVVLIYLFGLGSGYGIWGQTHKDLELAQTAPSEMEIMYKQVNPENGFALPVSFGDIGPQMVKAGVFDREEFIGVYQRAGKPLTEEQLSILDGTYQGIVVMNHETAYFLLNFLWAIGLSNQNPILESGPIQKNGQSGVEGFASTGGWSLATKPLEEIFASLEMIELTPEQQMRAEEAAKAVYRPCCDNSTHFPDCNHGMAMLGLLELMASQDVSLDDMFEAAKYVNAFWYPQQSLEQAVYFQKADGRAFADVDARTILGSQFSSRSGFNTLHQYLGEQGWLPQAPNSGGSCGV